MRTRHNRGCWLYLHRSLKCPKFYLKRRKYRSLTQTFLLLPFWLLTASLRSNVLLVLIFPGLPKNRPRQAGFLRSCFGASFDDVAAATYPSLKRPSFWEPSSSKCQQPSLMPIATIGQKLLLGMHWNQYQYRASVPILGLNTDTATAIPVVYVWIWQILFNLC